MRFDPEFWDDDPEFWDDDPEFCGDDDGPVVVLTSGVGVTF